MLHIEKLPPELCCRPDPLIVLSGLDIEKNSVHRSIWKAFTSGHNREREAFTFRCHPIDHEFPKPKAKPSTAYEWFLPKGILKTGWMRKHLEEIPAVVAVFYDLDWDERQWEEKSTECAQRLDTVRSKLAGRSECKLVLVLIQKRAPLPLGDDLNAMERAQALCTKCDLPGKNLFVLSHTNLLYGCITRLESEFHDMATNYYHNRAKRVKSHKDTLNKTSHQLLFIRHEFKIAFFGELKKDPALALKHYQQAYAHLLEQRMVDIHMLEMKTVAGFINYKICRLAFQSKASDAISQFRRHIEFFSNLVGMPQLAFEHEAWLSKQFEILGDLFQEAIQLSLTALMTQHPGLYYQEAARHAIARRQLCHVLCAQACAAAESSVEPVDTSWIPTTNQIHPDVPSFSDSIGNVDPFSAGTGKLMNVNTAVEFVRAQSPLRFARHSPSTPASPVNRPPLSTGSIENVGLSATQKLDGLEFYGQRPWRQGIQSMEPPNATKEREGILALQKEELNVDHSAIIIPLLEQTHLQYKRYKAERMKLYPCVLMGSEYYRKGNYAKALSCYTSVLSDYRHEKWWEIYTFVLKHIMECAYVTVQVTTFLSAGLELIGPSSQLPLPKKEIVQRLLFQLFRHEVPNDQQFLDGLGPVTDETKDRWFHCLNLSNDDNSSAISSDLPHSTLQSDDDINADSDKDHLSNVVLDVSHLNVCVECKVAFTQSHYTIDQPVQLAIFLKSYAPLPFGVYRVTVDLIHTMANLNPRGPVTERTQSRSTSKHTSQSWTQGFNLDSSASFKMLLLSIDSETLLKHVKVDSVQLVLGTSYSEVNVNTTPITLVWRWSSTEGSNTAPIAHRSNRPTALVTAHRTVTTDRTHLDPSHGPEGFSLWNTSIPASTIERIPLPLVWNVPKPTGLSDQSELPSIPPKWELIGTQLETEILEHNSKLQVTISHAPPALTRESYTLHCEILNNEVLDVTNMSLSVQLSEYSLSATGSELDAVARDHALRQKSSDQLIIGDASILPPVVSSPTGTQNASTNCTLQLADLKAGESVAYPISFRCLLPGRRSVHCQLTYQTNLPNPLTPDLLVVMASESPCNSPITRNRGRVVAVDDHRVNAVLHRLDSTSSGVIQSHCVKSTVVDLDVLEPFSLTWQTLSLEQWPISDLIVGDDFLLHITLTNTSSRGLEVLSTSFELTPSISFSDGKPEEELKNIHLEADESASECQVLVVSHAEPGEEVINLGSYVVQWRRQRDSSSVDESHVVTSIFPLLSCSLLELPVRVRVDMPSFGTLLTPMNVTYVFENQTIYPQEAQMTLEPSPSFMFSGQNKLKMRLLPDSPQYLSYVFLPLRSGNVVLPRLRVSLTRFGQTGSAEQHTLKLHVEEKMLRPIPTNLFVVPSGKGIGARQFESPANHHVSSG